MPDPSPGGTPLNVPGSGGIFDEAARRAAFVEAAQWFSLPNSPRSMRPADCHARAVDRTLNAALDALPPRTQAFLTLAGLSDEELVERVAASMHGGKGCTCRGGARGDARAALTALGLPVAEAGTTGDEER